MPTMAMSVSAASAGVDRRRRHQPLTVLAAAAPRRAPAGASRRGRCRSARPTAGAALGRGAVAVAAARARWAANVRTVGKRKMSVSASGAAVASRQAAEHLDGQQRVAADVEEVVVATDRPLELGAPDLGDEPLGVVGRRRRGDLRRRR